MSKQKIELGDEVQHIFTGFKGYASSRSEYLSGCSRIGIMPKVSKDGKIGEPMSFDEPEVEVIKKKKVKRQTKTGGWQPEVRHATR